MLRTTPSFLLALLVLVCGVPVARAANYPTRPITLVVAFTPGGASDVLARILGRKLEQILGQPLVIDNRPGAGGNVAAEAVAHAAPDGYTLFNGNNAILATNAALYKKINFDPEADFAPIGLIGSQANILVVNPALPPDTAWLRISSASCSRPRPRSTHVPYKGTLPFHPLLNRSIRLAQALATAGIPSNIL